MTQADVQKKLFLMSEKEAEQSALSERIQTLLEGQHVEIMDFFRKELEEFDRDELLDKTLDEKREIGLRWANQLAEKGLGAIPFKTEYGGEGNLKKSAAAMSPIAQFDLGLYILFGVQTGLYAKAIENLGTKYHHRKFLNDAMNFKRLGFFGLTESLHGSNALKIQTTATYDPNTDDLVIDTPTVGDRKDWVGNVARNGRSGVVFARLIHDGKDRGLVGIHVDIRDEDGNPKDGVIIGDNGRKVGLDVVDNGRLIFDNYRVKRTEMLNKFAKIDAAGDFHCDYSPKVLSFKTIGTLVGGRINVAKAAQESYKPAMTTAVNYAFQRRQFNEDENGNQKRLINYKLHQKRLIPEIAEIYAAEFGLDDAFDQYENVETHAEEIELNITASALKAYVTDRALSGLSIALKACGGNGFDFENNFGEISRNLPVFTIFEGENYVMRQYTSKLVMGNYRKSSPSKKVEQAFFYAKNKYFRSAMSGTDIADFANPKNQTAIFAKREEALKFEIGMRNLDLVKSGLSEEEIANELSIKLDELGRAVAERKLVDAFNAKVKTLGSDPELKAALTDLKDVFVANKIVENKGQLIELGILSSAQTQTATTALNDVFIPAVKDRALDLVRALGVTPHIQGSDIGNVARSSKAVKLNKEEITAHLEPSSVEEKKLTISELAVKGAEKRLRATVK